MKFFFLFILFIFPACSLANTVPLIHVANIVFFIDLRDNFNCNHHGKTHRLCASCIRHLCVRRYTFLWRRYVTHAKHKIKRPISWWLIAESHGRHPEQKENSTTIDFVMLSIHADIYYADEHANQNCQF